MYCALYTIYVTAAVLHTQWRLEERLAHPLTVERLPSAPVMVAALGDAGCITLMRVVMTATSEIAKKNALFMAMIF